MALPSQTVDTSSSKKRKADSLGRIASQSSSSGRGGVAGWTSCPMCTATNRRNKQFALGRGIAEHLHAIHTPWKDRTSPPTDAERLAWDAKVLEMVEHLERNSQSQRRGVDRNGDTARGYRDSIPEFLKAAADGDLDRLKALVDQAEGTLGQLLSTCDRHKSTAEQWAAGGGHLECLQYLIKLSDEQTADVPPVSKKLKIRRREGKSSLHYACRNGRLNCVKYLVNEHKCNINVPSGDGTTPLHLACFGGHQHVVEYLIANEANPKATNDWNCSAAHWVAMSKSKEKDALWGICNLLKRQGSEVFAEKQNQGHTPLHKAAQKKNRHVIEWLMAADSVGGAGLTEEHWAKMGQPDDGGHIPSELWSNAKGDDDIGKRLRERGC